MVRFPSDVRALAAVAALFTLLFLTTVGDARAGTEQNTGVRAGRGIVAGAPSAVWIAQEANHLSGRSLTLTCATTAGGWARSLAAVGLPSASALEYSGFSLVDSGAMHLSPYVCEGLRLGARQSIRRSDEEQVAWAVDVLIHESTHMGRFTYDEALTEACARVGLPIELNRLYGIEYHSSLMTRLTLAAARFRHAMAPAYQGGTCSRP